MYPFLYLFIGLGTILLASQLPSVASLTNGQRKFNYGPIQTGIAESKCETYTKQACDKGWLPKSPVPFIVGGRPAEPKEFPHMALIGGSEVAGMKWICGGSLISENFVLSAAHCNSTPIGDAKLIRLGELDFAISKGDKTPMDFLILEKFVHPGYNPPAMYNDIALFRFEGLKSFTEYIRPTCLNYLENLPNLTPIASGWGTTSYEGPTSTMLLAVELELYNITVCDQRIVGGVVPNGFNDTTMICAGLLAGGKDSCNGDSGGPLQFKKEKIKCGANIYSQIGIVSFGLGCGQVNTPGGYTKVSHYLPWIEKIVWSNETSKNRF